MSTTLQPGANDFQATIEGRQTSLLILKNKGGAFAAITNYGARWVSMCVPAKDGVLTDVIVGFDNIKDFESSTECYYGAIVGRFANRIGKGQFQIDGQEYQLATNNGVNHLHGGPKGFHSVVWDAEQLSENSVLLTYHSPDGEEGFPGSLDVELTYTLRDDNALHLKFKAGTDKATIINLTNHAYFNLNGVGAGSVANHLMEINANFYTPIDETSIPTGVLEAVEGTPFDFRKPVTIGARINEDDEQLKNGKGYDHNFVLNHALKNKMEFAAKAIGNESGIVMEVFTTEPGMQLYTGNFMKGLNNIKGKGKDEYRGAFCLETQHFPDSPNQPSFPSVLLLPEDVFESETVFKFSAV